jgi:Gram-negative bacterial TonB protein C-terminal
MKRNLLLVIALFTLQLVTAQAPMSAVKTVPFDYEMVQFRPEFPGGYNELMTFISNNFEASEEEGPSGVVKASFIIEKDGSLGEIKITKNIGSGVAGQELTRVLSISPKWKTGMNDGQPVRVAYELSISVKGGS